MNLDSAFLLISRDKFNKAGWETIYLGLRPRLIAHVSCLLVTFRMPVDDAEDVVHDALATALEKWDNVPLFESLSDFERYLKKMCRNLLIDRFRHLSTGRRLVEYLGLTFDRMFAPDAEMQRAVFVRQIITSLDGECGRMMKRFVEDGLTPAELAEQFGGSVAAAYTRWYRCLEKARDLFREAT